MSQIAINTSQNVEINFTIANIGERILAFLVDRLLQIAYLVAVFYVLFKVINMQQVFGTWDSWSKGAFLIVVTFPVYVYTLVCESLMEGQTFGKKLLKIKVVKIDGYQASFGDYLIRWLFRLVDIYITFLIGLITVMISKNHQRFGDMASGTAVISLKNKVNISHTIIENLNQDYVPLFPQVILLTDNDMRIIKENYLKAIKSGDRQIISRLASKIKEIIKAETDPTKITEKQFIGRVIKDYNYFTGREQ
ncbi:MULTISPECIES: RDD family protein [Chryseobacterium]|uniref:RDD family protein n=1 Tax=Chryseobacterium sp. R2A-55 TaxID=2744445 RepID=UPI001F3A1B7E|nr:RDD family protein [Chryseobacterium sp. R2A-55]